LAVHATWVWLAAATAVGCSDRAEMAPELVAPVFNRADTEAAAIFVDRSSTTGREDGTASSPFRTTTRALEHARTLRFGSAASGIAPSFSRIVIMDHGGRVDRIAGAPAALRHGDASQLVVHKGKEVPNRRGVAPGPGQQGRHRLPRSVRHEPRFEWTARD
jgi:hypothetical protein